MNETLVGHTPDDDQVVVMERNHPMCGYEAWIEHGPYRLLLRQVHPDLIRVLRASLMPTIRTAAA